MLLLAVYIPIRFVATLAFPKKHKWLRYNEAHLKSLGVFENMRFMSDNLSQAILSHTTFNIALSSLNMNNEVSC
jgi:hypothetical protein